MQTRTYTVTARNDADQVVWTVRGVATSVREAVLRARRSARQVRPDAATWRMNAVADHER